MLTPVLDHFACEQFLDHLNGLDKALETGRGFRPVVPNDMLVQRLAGTETEEEASRVHGLKRGCRLRDDGGMIAPAGRGNTGTETKRCRLSQGTEPRPDESRMTLRRHPGVEMVAGGHDTESSLFRLLAVFQHIVGMKLFE